MAKTPNYNWTTYEDGVTVINFQTDISNFIKDVDAKFKQQADAIAANATNIGLLGPSTLPISTGTGTIRYGRFGGFGWVEIDWTATEASALGVPTNFAQYLPVGSRPAFATSFLGRNLTKSPYPVFPYFLISAGCWVGLNQDAVVEAGERIQGSVVFPVA